MYKLDPKGVPVEECFRAIAIDQLDEALADLDKGDSEGRSVVHEARRRCKKLRGLLRLVRPAFPAFAAENAAIRDAAALLSHLRDAEVLRQTVGDLGKAHDNEVVKRVGERLAAEPQQQAAEGKLQEFRDRLAAIRARAEHWSLTKTGLAAILPGLRRTYRDDCRGMTTALKDGDPIAFHEWRKANKNHSFHVDLLKRTAPDILDADLKTIEKLSDLLGWHHDLAVLRAAVEHAPDRFGPAEDIAALNESIDLRRGEIEKDAFELGRQVLAERPRALAARFTRYWKSTP
jgi:CHAD domain-containing protein